MAADWKVPYDTFYMPFSVFCYQQVVSLYYGQPVVDTIFLFHTI